MARTYLQLVNDVLIRLRESTVTTNTATPYSTMVGAFVNDAKREVEDAYQWLALQDSLSYATIPGTFRYNTNSINTLRTGAPASDRSRLWIDPFLNKTVHVNESSIGGTLYISNIEYEPAFEDWQGKQSIILNNQQDIPVSFQVVNQQTFPDTAGLWNKQILLFPIPNNTYSMELKIINPPVDLSNDTDILSVPYYPVIMRAYLMCLYERGEELGESLTLTGDRVEQALANAIALEQQVSAQYQQMAIPYGAQY